MTPHTAQLFGQLACAMGNFHCDVLYCRETHCKKPINKQRYGHLAPKFQLAGQKFLASEPLRFSSPAAFPLLLMALAMLALPLMLWQCSKLVASTRHASLQYSLL